MFGYMSGVEYSASSGEDEDPPIPYEEHDPELKSKPSGRKEKRGLGRNRPSSSKNIQMVQAQRQDKAKRAANEQTRHDAKWFKQLELIFNVLDLEKEAVDGSPFRESSMSKMIQSAQASAASSPAKSLLAEIPQPVPQESASPIASPPKSRKQRRHERTRSTKIIPPLPLAIQTSKDESVTEVQDFAFSLQSFQASSSASATDEPTINEKPEVPQEPASLGLQGELSFEDMNKLLILEDHHQASVEGLERLGTDEFQRSLSSILAPCEDSWPARQKRLDALKVFVGLLKEAKEQMEDIGEDLTDPTTILQYPQLAAEKPLEYATALVNACYEALEDGVSRLDQPSTLNEALTACQLFFKLIAKLVSTDKTKRLLYGSEENLQDFKNKVGDNASQLLLEMIAAISRVQDIVFSSTKKEKDSGKQIPISYHELSNRGQMLANGWLKCSSASDKIISLWPKRANEINQARCQMLAEAAQLAEILQRDFLDAHQAKVLAEKKAKKAKGAWAKPPHNAEDAFENELQALLWLPACLKNLLTQSIKAAQSLKASQNECVKNNAGDVLIYRVVDKERNKARLNHLAQALYDLGILYNTCLVIDAEKLAVWAKESICNFNSQAIQFALQLEKSAFVSTGARRKLYKKLREATEGSLKHLLDLRHKIQSEPEIRDEAAIAGKSVLVKTGPDSSQISSYQDKGLQAPKSVSEEVKQSILVSSFEWLRKDVIGWMRRSTPSNVEPTASESSSLKEPLKIEVKKTGSGAKKHHRVPSETHPINTGSRFNFANIIFGRTSSHASLASSSTSQPNKDEQESDLEQATEPSIDTQRPSQSDRDPAVLRTKYQSPFIQDAGTPFKNGHKNALKQTTGFSPQPRNGFPVPSESSSTHEMNDVFHAQSPQTPPASISFGKRHSTVENFQPRKTVGFVEPDENKKGSTSESKSNTQSLSSTEAQEMAGGLRGSKEESLGGIGKRIKVEPDSHARIIENRSNRCPPEQTTFIGPHSDPTGGSHFGQGQLAGLLKLERIKRTSIQKQESQKLGDAFREKEGNLEPGSAKTVFHTPFASVAEQVSLSSTSSDPSENLEPLSISAREPLKDRASMRRLYETTVGWKKREELSIVNWEDLQSQVQSVMTLTRDSLDPTSQFGHPLGSGSFGVVFQTHLNGEPVAVKVFQVDENNAEDALERFMEEADLQRQLSSNQNVVRFLGACCHVPNPASDDFTHQDFRLAIAMELCKHGELHDMIGDAARLKDVLTPDVMKDRSTFENQPWYQNSFRHRAFTLFNEFSIRVDIMARIARALAFMHSKGVVHKDLTSHNIFITDKLEAKLGDFGLSGRTDRDKADEFLNSVYYAAPEKIEGDENYDERAADVYSFGIVLYEILTLKEPWSHVDTESNSNDSMLCCNKNFFIQDQVKKGERPPFPSLKDINLGQAPVPDEISQLVDLTKSCWDQDPKKRPPIKQVGDDLERINRKILARDRRSKLLYSREKFQLATQAAAKKAEKESKQ